MEVLNNAKIPMVIPVIPDVKNKVLKPEILVIAGPNGSGKSTITKMMNVVGLYINADDIKKSTLCSDLEAALRAEELRESALAKNLNFSFRTLLFCAVFWKLLIYCLL